MGVPAAKIGDTIVGICTHIIMIPSPGGPVPTPIPGHPFNAPISLNVSMNVMVNGQPAATQGSQGMTNIGQHPPMGGPFQIPPTFMGTVMMGSATVMINGKGAARMADTCQSCGDIPVPGVQVVATSPNVMIG